MRGWTVRIRYDVGGDVCQVDDDDDENAWGNGFKDQYRSDAVDQHVFFEPCMIDVSGIGLTIDLWNRWTHVVDAAPTFSAFCISCAPVLLSVLLVLLTPYLRRKKTQDKP